MPADARSVRELELSLAAPEDGRVSYLLIYMTASCLTRSQERGDGIKDEPLLASLEAVAPEPWMVSETELAAFLMVSILKCVGFVCEVVMEMVDRWCDGAQHDAGEDLSLSTPLPLSTHTSMPQQRHQREQRQQPATARKHTGNPPTFPSSFHLDPPRNVGSPSRRSYGVTAQRQTTSGCSARPATPGPARSRIGNIICSAYATAPCPASRTVMQARMGNSDSLFGEKRTKGWSTW